MKQILLAEDEPSIAELERDYLEVAGFGVKIAASGDTGLSLLRAEQFDLIILDIMLPGIDGFELCRRIRTESDVPLIMVSARNEDIDKIRGLGLGADDYVTKPFSPGELVARVKSHLARYDRLRNGTEDRAAMIRIRDLSIDTRSRRVFIGDTEVSLTAREFELLQFFATNPDRVFSKEQLFDRIWGEETHGDIGTISVHIRRIREKIERDPGEPVYIVTVWGVGYRFAV